MTPERRPRVDATVIVAGTIALGVLSLFAFEGRGAALDHGIAVAIGAWFASLGVWWLVRRAAVGRLWKRLTRGALTVAALILCLAAAYRGRQLLRGDFAWPPPARPLSQTLPRLTGDDALLWSVRVAAHALTSRDSALQSGTIPRDWPMPDGMEIRQLRRGDTLIIMSKVTTGRRACIASLVDGRFLAREARAPISCTDAGPRDWETAVRIQMSDAPHHRAQTAAPAESVPGTSWTQYRGVADRRANDARTANVTSAIGWRNHLGGEIRSSVAIADDIVVTGSHGTGTLMAVSARTGALVWQTTVPNWIHEDPVVAEGIVAVGFGDSGRSFYGRAPAGVAAYDLHNGHLLWTAFESNSVMTSPVVFGNRIIYATAGGMLVSRTLHSGDRTGEIKLPGAVQMAPPALTDSSIIIAADPNWLCSIDARTLAKNWCTATENGASASGSAPSVISGSVIQSMVQPVDALSPIREIKRLGVDQYLATLAGIVRGSSYRPGGQFVASYDLGTGALQWRTRSLPATRAPRGHSSGTAVALGSGVAVLLPVPDAVVSIDGRTGREVWRQPGHAGRGPALAIGDDLYVFAPDGTIRVISGRDGAIRCSIATSASFDRAGPTAYGELLIGGSIQGDLFALPRSMLDRCDSDGVRRIVEPAKN